MLGLSKRAANTLSVSTNFGTALIGALEKGSKLSIIAFIDQPNNASPALSAAQTPPHLAAAETDKNRLTRIDFYLQHFLETVRPFPKAVEYLLVDGFYAKLKFVNRSFSKWLSPH